MLSFLLQPRLPNRKASQEGYDIYAKFNMKT
jgi:hypothetical protein